MSNYTTQLRYIIENETTDIGLNDYPIFDEKYREKLNSKIINHYYLREIGFETFGLFKFKMKNKMNEIMPYYNELYKTVQMEYDPLVTYDITETMNRNVQGTNDISGETKEQFNDTPMGSLGNPFHEDYATNTNQGSSSTMQNNKSTEVYSRQNKGKNDSKSYAELIQEYRKAIINVDMLIIAELGGLFMGLW